MSKVSIAGAMSEIIIHKGVHIKHAHNWHNDCSWFGVMINSMICGCCFYCNTMQHLPVAVVQCSMPGITCLSKAIALLRIP